MSVVPAFLHQSIADSAREHNESAEKLFDPTVLSTDDLQAIVSSQAVNFASQPVVVAASMEIAKRQRAATDASAVVEATRYSDGSVIQPPFPPHMLPTDRDTGTSENQVKLRTGPGYSEPHTVDKFDHEFSAHDLAMIITGMRVREYRKLPKEVQDWATSMTEGD